MAGLRGHLIMVPDLSELACNFTRSHMIKTFRIRIRMDQALYGREQCAAAKLASEAQRVGIAPA